MGSAMDERIGRGDTAVNLAATGLAANAWLYGHEDRFRDWVLEYVDAWRERAAANGGVLPDNVGPSGRVGELHGGALVRRKLRLGLAARRLQRRRGRRRRRRSTRCWSPARRPARPRPRHRSTPSLRHGMPRHGRGSRREHRDRLGRAELGVDERPRHCWCPTGTATAGWFDFQPPQLGLSVWLWHAARGEHADRDRLDRLRKASGYDWATYGASATRRRPGTRRRGWSTCAATTPASRRRCWRRARPGAAAHGADRRGPAAPDACHVHHWQRLNPVLTEALLQLATGTPQVLYNGGLLPTRLAYFDADTPPPRPAARCRRPGRPRRADGRARRTGAHRGDERTRRVVVQAGAFGEHRSPGPSSPPPSTGYPGDPRSYVAPERPCADA